MTTVPADARQRFAARLLASAACCALLAWLSLYVAVGYPWTQVGSYVDAHYYLLSADALTQGVDAAGSRAGATWLTTGRFPPGYPLYLSLFGAARDAEGLVRANLAQMLSLLLMLALCFGYFARAGGSRTKAVLALLAIPALSFVQPWSLELTSEPLFTAMLAGACWMALLPAFPRRWLWMGTLLGLAALVRTLGLVLAPVLALWTWRETRDWRRAAASLLLACAPALAWQAFQWLGHAGTHSYATEFQSGIAGIGGWWSSLGERASLLLAALTPRQLPGPAFVAFGLLLLAALLAAAPRAVRAGDFGSWAALAMLATLLAWPYPEHLERLAGPVAPLLVAVLLAHLRRADTAPVRRPLATTLSVSLLALGAGGHLLASQRLLQLQGAVRDPLLAPYLRSVVAYNRDDPTRELENYHQVLVAASMLEQFVPPGACVLTTMQLVVRQRSDADVRLLRPPFPPADSSCEYVLAVNLAARDGVPALYPLDSGQAGLQTVYTTLTSERFLSAALLKRVPDGH